MMTTELVTAQIFVDYLYDDHNRIYDIDKYVFDYWIAIVMEWQDGWYR